MVGKYFHIQRENTTSTIFGHQPYCFDFNIKVEMFIFKYDEGFMMVKKKQLKTYNLELISERNP